MILSSKFAQSYDLQVDLIGGEPSQPRRHLSRKQLQAGISYIKVVGTPLYNFAAHKSATTVSLPVEAELADMRISSASTSSNPIQSSFDESRPRRVVPPCSVVLRYITADPLVQAGGLYRVCEAGRLPHEQTHARDKLHVQHEPVSMARNLYGSDSSYESEAYLQGYPWGYPEEDMSE